MKKSITLCILFFAALAFSQTGNKSSYGPGTFIQESIPVYDTANTITTLKIPHNNSYFLIYRDRWIDIGKGIDNADSIKLLQDKIASALLGGMVGNLRVICLAYDRSSNYESWKQRIKQSKPFKPNKGYKTEYYNINGQPEVESKCREMFTKLTFIGPDGKVLGQYSSIEKFRYYLKEEKINLKGKVVSDDNGTNEPLEKIRVQVSGKNKDTLGTALTDKFGDFEMKIPNNDSSYTIRAQVNDKNIKNMLLMTQEGKPISYLRKNFQDFEYKLLKADILELAEIKTDEDISLTFKKFEGSADDQLLVVEDLIYALDQYSIDKQSEEILNKVVTILQQNEKVKLEIISHTDAQGDDASNLALSEKRAGAVAGYLAGKGISKKRIKAVGKGETQLRNRCGNGISCTDKEHRYNRRTELKFTK